MLSAHYKEKKSPVSNLEQVAFHHCYKYLRKQVKGRRYLSNLCLKVHICDHLTVYGPMEVVYHAALGEGRTTYLMEARDQRATCLC